MSYAVRRLLALGVSLLLAMPAHASLIFTFTFDDTVGAGGNTKGPITGEIRGLVDNSANQQATKVVISSVGSHPVFGHALPFDVIGEWTVAANSFFTVKESAIVEWLFSAGHAHGANDITFELFNLGGTTGALPLLAVGASQGLRSTRSSDPPLFLLQVTAIPAPSALLLVGIGLVGMCWARRRTR